MNQFAEMPAGTRPLAAWPTSTTAIAGVVGFPIRHSLSPLLHNAAFAAMGLDWSYLAFEVPSGSLDRAVAGASALGLRGLSVTMPHKDAAARLSTRRSRQVRRLGAANTLIFDAGAILAESCDGEGLLDDLREGVGFDPAGRHCGVIGAGGAGRAAVLALADAGAEEIVIVNRTVAPAWRSALLAPNVARVGRPEDLGGMDLVVQATPVAMASTGRGGEEAPVETAELTDRAGSGGSTEERSAVVAGVDPSWFGAGQLVVDLVYEPALTPFLLEARRGGASVRNGLGMLVYQAARQIRLWTGAEPPLSVMWAAVGGDGSSTVASGAATRPAESATTEPIGGTREPD
ncbi:MAG: shikimate dehydrogenase [Acidimicrobiales bacterium]